MSSRPPTGTARRLGEPSNALFLGPPSQNASNVSLSGAAHQFGSTLQPSLTAGTVSTTASRLPMSRRGSRGLVPRSGDVADGPSMTGIHRGLPRIQSDGQTSADRTDALWAHMQSTLEEVELTAIRGTHVFGAEHTKALDGLRTAQIALAQAWARSEADDAVETIRDVKAGKSSGVGSEGKTAPDGTEQSGLNSGSIRPDSHGDTGDSKLEEDTEADIRLARRRREANDQYFQRVNGGVLDVVSKLEEVAQAMKAVEKESRDIWDSPSDFSSSTDATTDHQQNSRNQLNKKQTPHR